MKVALLNAGDYNVIQLDWSQGNGYPYTLATANTRVVGALVAQFIVWLESNFGANRENFHLIGHSLGAHVSGYAGERLSTGSKKLGRITGMDPAGPYFEYTHPEVRLDPTDARFVDAIHTDGDSTLSIIKLSGGFGLMQPVGHVDFYPNGGKSQPNCNEPPSDSVSGIIGGTVWRMTCSHNRVRAMMISTIANPRRNYVAYPCASYEDFKAGRCRTCGTTGCASMGMRAAEWRPNGRVNVKMFLDTAGTEPFEKSTFREVCYDGLGCFSTRGNFYDSVNRPIQVLPQDPDRIRLTFALYTRRNVNTAQNLIVIHGFTGNGNSDWNQSMKRALLNEGDYNVIQLDWSRGSGFPFTQATANTRVVGALVAQFIVWLESNFGANRENFHLIGHSLGAHVSGYAGERLNTRNKKLGRISGLDPAGPYFENTHPEVRLDPTDAPFVDAIHTDGDSTLSIIKLSGGFGLMQPVGHVDFYPNGGKSQPNCNEPPSGSVGGIIGGTVWRMTCSHNRVQQVMVSTILNPRKNYRAYPCSSYEDFKAGRCRTCGTTGCASMGIRAGEWNPNGRVNVKMFLDTAGTEPFASLE
uniref:Lipase domain-containing protein n=1 Tax=Macrostomum lignano TaxID=282301 RepID=A0A1I8JH39_9PLAT